jgi:acetylornithine deacetylase
VTAPDVIAEIAALVRIPSVSSVLPELDMSNRPLIEHLAARFETLGFRCRMQEVPQRPGKWNLIATLGAGEGGLVLAGHTDTVPTDQHRWSTDPFEAVERSGRLYGLGTSDMKSFFALAAAAIEGLQARSLRQPLVVIGTADEESSMAGARALVSTSALRPRYALIGEPTDLRPVRLHKGILMERISVEGRSGHSSDPRLGRSALEGMQRIIAELLDWRAELTTRYVDQRFAVPHPTLNLGRIAGGDNPNRICAHCELDLDLRCLPGMEVDGLRAELRARASRAIEGSGLAVMFTALLDGVPPMSTAADSAIVRAAEELTGVEAGAVAFATEAPFLAGLGAEVIVLGPGSIDQAHQPDEFLDLHTVPVMIRHLRGLIERFCLH